jgi:hypothetical protein
VVVTGVGEAPVLPSVLDAVRNFSAKSSIMATMGMVSCYELSP